MDLQESVVTTESSRIDSLPVQYRRLDSLATLLQGKDPCGATVLDGTQLVIATNKVTARTLEFTGKIGKYEHPSGKVLSYLGQLIQKIELLKNSATDQEAIFEKISVHTNTILEAFKSRDKRNLKYQTEVETALYKMIDTLFRTVITPQHPEKLHPDLLTALDNGKILLSQTTKRASIFMQK